MLPKSSVSAMKKPTGRMRTAQKRHVSTRSTFTTLITCPHAQQRMLAQSRRSAQPQASALKRWIHVLTLVKDGCFSTS